MSQCSSEPYERSGGNVKVELDLSNYESKSNVKKHWVLIRHHLKKKCFSQLNIRIDKLGIKKLKTVTTDLRKVVNEVDNDVVKKAVYDK